ncbi:MAG: bifunctional phosphopantothenoylcysteine decarboxylase/phosphopantothenate--cysteine ligase CoaBC [Candidatus Roizmanbacteria bacterium]|nr:bifunctional phosphopantothenoylcysteine decarboxylase/phosphopantothenate--cysteine ligase CoaBC [Candidatus Roizmanbacteria bacterium]
MKKNILIGVSSGIAAYKILDLIKLLKNEGHEVFVIMTRGASEMFSKKDFEKASGNKVFIDLFEKNFDYREVLKNKKVGHIELADKCDVMVIAPATANIIGKLANGLADDFLTTTALAVTSPIIICPSMNVNMWSNPIVQENLSKLKLFGYQVIEPASGMLACGYEGVGRLENVEIINKEINKLLEKSNSMRGKKVIVTAGGTVEKIDEVRSIINRSSGKMGIALAEECYIRGADVLLLRAKNSVYPRYLIKEKIFETAEELLYLIKVNIKNTNLFFQVAAVSDFKVDKQINGKLSSDRPVGLKLVPQIKIIDQIKKLSPKTILVAFKAEYGLSEKELINEAVKKLKDSKADYVIANDISRTDRGFESDNNEIYIISKNKKFKKISLTSKRKIAEEIIDCLSSPI